jgi:Tol biopolymer transport system component
VWQLTWHGRDGGGAEPVGKPGEYASFSLSPDATKVAVLAGSKGTRSTLVMDVLTGVLSPMTRDGKELVGTAPIWSADGEQLALGQVGGGIRIVTVRSGALRMLTDKYSPEDWSPDGRSILATDRTHAVLIPVETNGKPQTILESTYLNTDFRFSPDGKYVAYTSFESGVGEVYVAAFPSFAVKRKISTNSGSFPAWTKGGKEILYGTSDQTMMSVEVHLGSTIEPSVPRPLFRIAGRTGFFNRFAAGSDGSRILFREAVAEATEKPRIAVVLNWAGEMR